MIYASSLACANLLNLEADVRELIEAGHPMLHVDIMDGHYVPNLCLNLDLVKALKEKFDCRIEVHLMVEDPFRYVQPCADAGVDDISFHLAGTKYPYRLLAQMKEAGMRAGIVLNPRERVEELGGLVEALDYCLVMSVEPGFSGQSFMDTAYGKIEELDRVRREKNLKYLISVDGGINVENGRACRALGADILVMGMFSFFNQRMPIRDACRAYVSQIEELPERAAEERSGYGEAVTIGCRV